MNLNIQQVSFTSSPWTYLDGTPSTDNHQDHFQPAFRAFRTTNKIFMTVRTKEIQLGIKRNFIFGFKIKTSIKRGEPIPSVLPFK